MTLSESLSVWFIKAVDESIIRSFICFFIIITHISNFGHGTENLLHTNCAHINFFLIALLIIIIFFLSVISSWRWRKGNRISVSLFVFPVGSTESLERCMDEVLPHKTTEFSVCCLLELFDTDVKSVNHTHACAHIVTVFICSCENVALLFYKRVRKLHNDSLTCTTKTKKLGFSPSSRCLVCAVPMFLLGFVFVSVFSSNFRAFLLFLCLFIVNSFENSHYLYTINKHLAPNCCVHI